jgi:hypothetical protein
MPKELKPGWIYINNDNPIGLEYAIHETGWVYFEDGVRYSPEEIRILKESGGPASKSVHNIKKIFNGEIVRYEQKTNIKGNPGESNTDKNTFNNTPSGENMSENATISSQPEQEELDIF